MFDFLVDKQMFVYYNTNYRTVVRANRCSIVSILVYDLFCMEESDYCISNAV